MQAHEHTQWRKAAEDRYMAMSWLTAEITKHYFPSREHFKSSHHYTSLFDTSQIVTAYVRKCQVVEHVTFDKAPLNFIFVNFIYVETYPSSPFNTFYTTVCRDCTNFGNSYCLNRYSTLSCCSDTVCSIGNAVLRDIISDIDLISWEVQYLSADTHFVCALEVYVIRQEECWKEGLAA